MSQFTVRNVEDDVKARLKQRAVRHGTSLEAEVRTILRNAVKDEGSVVGPGLGSRIAARFAKVGLASPFLELRGQVPRPAVVEEASQPTAPRRSQTAAAGSPSLARKRT